MADMRLIVAGAGGRMGRTLIQAIAATSGVTLAGAVEAPGSPVIGRDAGELAGLGASGIAVAGDVAPLLDRAEGVIDFTVPAASVALAERIAGKGLVHVIGTTGLSPEQDKAIAAAATRAVIVKSGNMSLGVNLLAALIKRVARTLDDEFDIEIIEMHHNKKIDAPSGTALMFGRAAAEGRNIDLSTHSVRARDGHTGARRPGDIGFAALRRHRRGRARGHFRRSRRADRTRAQGGGSHDLRARCTESGAVGARPEARILFDGRRIGIDELLMRRFSRGRQALSAHACSPAACCNRTRPACGWAKRTGGCGAFHHGADCCFRPLFLFFYLAFPWAATAAAARATSSGSPR
jgi:4-hydroxy-tetrahydrodipicolinate reductase